MHVSVRSHSCSFPFLQSHLCTFAAAMYRNCDRCSIPFLQSHLYTCDDCKFTKCWGCCIEPPCCYRNLWMCVKQRLYDPDPCTFETGSAQLLPCPPAPAPALLPAPAAATAPPKSGPEDSDEDLREAALPQPRGSSASSAGRSSHGGLIGTAPRRLWSALIATAPAAAAAPAAPAAAAAPSLPDTDYFLLHNTDYRKARAEFDRWRICWNSQSAAPAAAASAPAPPRVGDPMDYSNPAQVAVASASSSSG